MEIIHSTVSRIISNAEFIGKCEFNIAHGFNSEIEIKSMCAIIKANDDHLQNFEETHQQFLNDFIIPVSMKIGWLQSKIGHERLQYNLPRDFMETKTSYHDANCLLKSNLKKFNEILLGKS